SNTAAATYKSNAKRSTSHRRGKKKATARGQQKIDPQRAEEIQEALIREHYLSGDAAGTWNQASEDAMRRYQADHGWQSKTVPDARALISLGLGPSHDHLLNPESAMTTEPVTHASSLSPVSHSADPGARTNTTPAPATPAVPATTPDH
ncbi:MAG: peptidoglycan-binding domain-containing protein, partial [Candidatus Sulfotelmatobacter sp.]